jgi:NADH-quinone oxidoreductase subunit L
VLGGALQLPFSKSLHFLEHWLEPVIEDSQRSIKGSWAYENKYVLLVVAIIVAATGITLALLAYAKGRLKVVEPTILERAWRYDAAVARIIGGPGAATFRAITAFDSRVVDGAVNGAASLVRATATPLRKAQSGYVRAYALIVGIGTVLVVAWFVLRALAGGV